VTSISNMNIVVQQSGEAKGIHGVRHSSQEYSQVVAAHQKEKDAQQQTAVQQPDQSERSKFERASADGNNRKRRKKAKKKKKTPTETQHSGSSGKLVNTVA